MVREATRFVPQNGDTKTCAAAKRRVVFASDSTLPVVEVHSCPRTLLHIMSSETQVVQNCGGVVYMKEASRETAGAEAITDVTPPDRIFLASTTSQRILVTGKIFLIRG